MMLRAMSGSTGSDDLPRSAGPHDASLVSCRGPSRPDVWLPSKDSVRQICTWTSSTRNAGSGGASTTRAVRRARCPPDDLSLLGVPGRISASPPDTHDQRPHRPRCRDDATPRRGAPRDRALLVPHPSSPSGAATPDDDPSCRTSDAEVPEEGGTRRRLKRTSSSDSPSCSTPRAPRRSRGCSAGPPSCSARQAAAAPRPPLTRR